MSENKLRQEIDDLEEQHGIIVPPKVGKKKFGTKAEQQEYLDFLRNAVGVNERINRVRSAPKDASVYF